jgi:hypothetical protein
VNQLLLENNLGIEPQADRLMLNMLYYCDTFSSKKTDKAAAEMQMETYQELIAGEEDFLIAKPTALPLPLDGDPHKWTDEVKDKNVSPWARAVPIVIRDKNAVNGVGKLPGRKVTIGICYLLYDKENLYFAAQLISERFAFDRVELLDYERDCVELRIRGTTFRIGRKLDGTIFSNSKGLVENGSVISGKITLFDDLSKCADLSLVQLDRTLPLKAAFIEVKIPFSILPFSFDDMVKKGIESSISINWGDPDSDFRAGQFSYPYKTVWNNISTFSTLVFK